jgi:hypothetical protein
MVVFLISCSQTVSESKYITILATHKFKEWCRIFGRYCIYFFFNIFWSCRSEIPYVVLYLSLYKTYLFCGTVNISFGSRSSYP